MRRSSFQGGNPLAQFMLSTLGGWLIVFLGVLEVAEPGQQEGACRRTMLIDPGDKGGLFF
jgi:hypothetical protein